MAISDRWEEKGYKEGRSVEVLSPVSIRHFENKRGKEIGVIVCFAYLDEVYFDIPIHGWRRFCRKFFGRGVSEVEGFRKYLKQYIDGKFHMSNYQVSHQFEWDLVRVFARFSVTHFDDATWDMDDDD